MRSLAVKVLADYDLQMAWIKFLADAMNISFEVRPAAGGNYLLCMYSDEERYLLKTYRKCFYLSSQENINQPCGELHEFAEQVG